jgi:peptidyl-prolyl cis-trans isomerase SurA
MRDCLIRKMYVVGMLSGIAFAFQTPVHAQSVTSAGAMKSVQASPAFVDAIVAVVNTGTITRRELDTRLQELEKRLTSQGIALPPKAELERQLLERMIVELAQIQLAKEGGITVDETMLDRALTQIAAQNNLSLPDFRAQLEKEGIEYPKFREEIRREIMMQRVRERNVNGNVQVPESEIDNYLAAESSAAATRDDLHLAHILIRVPENATAAEINERRQRAEAVRARIEQGEDFAKTAATFSDSSDALNGGDLGVRSRDRLPQLFLDGVANLQSGQVSPVIKSANGFHIIKLVERKTGGKTGAVGPAVQQTRARHILVKVNQLVSAADARRKIADIKQRLDNNAGTFEELAKQYSEDGSAAQGGDLGWIYAGDTVPQFESAMNELQPGQVSGPVESPFGFHLIQVLERKTDDASQERTRQAVRQAIRERKLEQATEEWLRELRDATYVEYREGAPAQ